jgi:glycerol-3-phosphate dehydrogenase
VEDVLGGRKTAVRARAVVNATGAAADALRGEVDGAPRMRPLRGSHLVFPSWRFPLATGVSLQHPRDGRFLSALPWEDVTLFGTTDVDHAGSPVEEPSITPAEVAYLLEALEAYFPALALRAEDVVSTFAGVRPIVSAGFADPSREPRDSWVGLERGLLTVTGGKLTTCRATAHAALAALRSRVPELARLDTGAPLLDTAPAVDLGARLPAHIRARLLGRYGADARSVVEAAGPGELESVADTSTLWAELRWAARAEGPGHLDDLLLRRVRLGLMLPAGGAGILERVREICAGELGWDPARWQEEAAAYAALWRGRYALPATTPAVLPSGTA